MTKSNIVAILLGTMLSTSVFPMAIAEKLGALFLLKQEEYKTRPFGKKVTTYFCDPEVVAYVDRLREAKTRTRMGSSRAICAQSKYEDTHKFVDSISEQLDVDIAEFDCRKASYDSYDQLLEKMKALFEQAKAHKAAGKQVIIHVHHAEDSVEVQNVLWHHMDDDVEMRDRNIFLFISTEGPLKGLYADLRDRCSGQNVFMIEGQYGHGYFNLDGHKENLKRQDYNRGVILVNGVLVGCAASVSLAALLLLLEIEKPLP